MWTGDTQIDGYMGRSIDETDDRYEVYVLYIICILYIIHILKIFLRGSPSI